MHVWRIAIGCALVLGCGDSTGPNGRTLRLGAYTHTFQHDAIPGALAAASYSGTVQITTATPDSAVATFSVTGYTTAPVIGRWNSSAYRFDVSRATGPLLFLRLTRAGCQEGRATVLTSAGTLASTTGPCTFQLR